MGCISTHPRCGDGPKWQTLAGMLAGTAVSGSCAGQRKAWTAALADIDDKKNTGALIWWWVDNMQKETKTVPKCFVFKMCVETEKNLPFPFYNCQIFDQCIYVWNLEFGHQIKNKPGKRVEY